MLLRRRTIDPRSDEELVDLLRAGHRASLGLLWDRYAHLLFGVGLHYLKNAPASEDAVADVFARLPDLLEAHRVEHFRAWLHAVMRNHCLQALRKHDPEVRDERRIERAAESDGIADRVLHEATLQELERAIEGLNDRQRTCIRLFYLERLSYAQVQERTGLTFDEVRSHLQNGRRNLKIALQRKNITPP